MSNIKIALIVAIASMLVTSGLMYVIAASASVVGYSPFLLGVYMLSSYASLLVAFLFAYWMYVRRSHINLVDALLVSIYYFVFVILSKVLISIIVGVLINPASIFEVIKSTLVFTALPFLMTGGNASTTLDMVTKMALLFTKTSVLVVAILYAIPPLLTKLFRK